MSARSQLQSKPVADLRQIADGLGLEHAGLQKAKLIDLLLVLRKRRCLMPSTLLLKSVPILINSGLSTINLATSIP